MTEPGRHSDGGGLYLVVKSSGAKHWAFLYRWKDTPTAAGVGRMREMGLGSFDSVPLAKARAKAAAARELLADGVDPIAARKAESAVPSFGAMADRVLETRTAELRSDKSVARWKRSLETYAAALRPLRIDAVQTAEVVDVLKPIWATKSVTATNVRRCIEAVLDAAKAEGFRTGENPARWRGHLDHLLPKPKLLTRGHHKALPYAGVFSFMADLREREGVAPIALEFLILTAARTGEVLGAQWSEIDLNERVWTVPARRMKGGLEHRVALSTVAIAALERVRDLRRSEADPFVFPGQATGKALSSGGMERVLDRMKVAVTVHGFRSTFKDWAVDATQFPDLLSEQALAHVVGDESRRAYARSDALEKRRKLMEAWASYCGRSIGGSVVLLGKVSGSSLRST